MPLHASLTRKYFKRKDEAFAPLLNSGKEAFEVWEPEECSLSRSHRGAGPTRLLFSIFVIRHNRKGTNWTDGNSEPSFLSTTEATIVSCPHVDRKTKRQPHAEPRLVLLQATHTRLHKKALHSAQLWGSCRVLWQHLPMYFVAVPYFGVKVIEIEDCFHMTCRIWA